MTPTVGELPESGARPCGAAAAITSLHNAPPPTLATRRPASTVTALIGLVFSSSPPSGIRAAPWPVDWTATGRSCSRAKRSAVRTSLALAASTISAGWGSRRRCQGSRAAS